MSEKPQHIEELFQNTFKGFESDVNPALWDKISNSIQSPASAPTEGGLSSSGAAASGMSAVKIAAIIGIGGSLVGAGIWFSTADEANQPSAQDTETSAVLTEEYKNTGGDQATSITFEEAQKSNEVKTEIAEVENANPNKEINSQTEEKLSHQSAEQGSTKQENVSNVVRKAPAPVVVKDESGSVDALAREVLKESPQPVRKSEEDIVKPMASIHASVKSGSLPLSVQFSNNDRNEAELIWDFGDGSIPSHSDAPYHTFNQAGDYAVILKVKGEDNWESRDTMIITVRKNLAVMIPNIFTPNNDGINDVFKVEIDESASVSYFECVVMDRSANVVYKTNNLFSHWNGQDMANRDCQQGPYYYVVKISRESLPDEVFKGVVQLKR